MENVGHEKKQIDVRLEAGSLVNCANPIARVFIDSLGDFIRDHQGVGMMTLWCRTWLTKSFKAHSGQ